MSNNNLPTSLSFFDKLRLLFSGSLDKMLREVASEQSRLQKYEANLEERDKDLDAREEILKERDKDLDARDRDLDAREAILIERQATLNDLTALNQQNISSPEIQANKSKVSALMTTFFEKYIIQETENLKTNLAELEAVNAPQNAQDSIIANYQASLLGSLLAYTQFDTISNPEIKKTIEQKICNILEPLVQNYPQCDKSLKDSYLLTRYESHSRIYDTTETNSRFTSLSLETALNKINYYNTPFFDENGKFTDPIQASTVEFNASFSNSDKCTLKDLLGIRHDFNVPFTINHSSKRHTTPLHPSYGPDLLKAFGKIPEEFRPSLNDSEQSI